MLIGLLIIFVFDLALFLSAYIVSRETLKDR